MITVIRKKVIVTSAISVILSLVAIYVVVAYTSISQLNTTLDTLTDLIHSHNGVFPDVEKNPAPSPGAFLPENEVVTEETKYSTRFFAVWFDENKNVISENIDFVASLTDEEVRSYGENAVNKRKNRGWISQYRFKKEKTADGYMVVFVNGSIERFLTYKLLLNFFLILTASGLGVMIFIFLLSKKIVKPISESYEKQKQFVTDANHELKTPLTLILSNIEILEREVSANEWLEDIKYESERMKMLVNQLVSLSRMDEDKSDMDSSEFNLTTAINDAVSEFKPLAEEKEKNLNITTAENVEYIGNEGAIRKLMSILLDNAVKYCDAGGHIDVILYKKRNPVIIVENTYKDTANIETNKLFDRFYKGDKSRVYDGSFGIGLSIAQSIVQKHSGEITAYTKENKIGFKIIIK